MPDVFADPPAALYVVLFTAAVAAAFVWLRTRDRKALVAAAVAGGLLAVLFAVAALFDSPREGAERATWAIAEAINERDWAKFDANVSDRFSTPAFRAKADLTFTRDPDGRWRLRAFTPYDYIQKRSEVTIPGLR